MPTSNLRSIQTDRLTSKVVDQKGRQAKNGGDATDPQDFVTLKQLQDGITNINASSTVVTQTVAESTLVTINGKIVTF